MPRKAEPFPPSAPTIVVKSNTEQKVKDCVKVLEEKMVKRKIAIKALQAGNIEPAS